MKRIYLSALLSIFVSIVYAQEPKSDSLRKKLSLYQFNLTNAVNTPNTFTPKVIPPSPDAASLGRYGEFPVTMSKGTPNISIPLYTIQSGGLSLPLGLNYHASGVRVNDVASSVGLSWSLMGIGAVTRSLNGLPDDFSGGFIEQNIPSETPFTDFMCFIGKLAHLDGTFYDGSPDFFFYNFGNESGKFMYANKQSGSSNANLSTKVPVTIPYKPLKIEGSPADGFNITNPDGTIYIFGGDVNGKTSTETTYRNEAPTNFISTYYLSHIISANRIDTIKIEYTTAVFPTTPVLWSKTLVKSVSDGTQTSYDYQKGANYGVISTIYPSTIYFKNGKVSFNYLSRDDLDVGKRLNSIYIYQKETAGTYSEIKHFTLSQSYFTAVDGYSQIDQYGGVSNHSGSEFLKRLRLDKVTEGSPTSTACEIPSYKFTYNQSTPLPIIGSFAQDYWGFYNGASNNTKLLIQDTNLSLNAEPSATYGADRVPNFTYAISGILQEIQFPTGGKTVFTFEPHQFTSGSTVLDGGGIRIKSITNYSENRLSSRQEFAYPGAYFTTNIYAGNMNNLAYRFSATEEVSNGTNGFVATGAKFE